LADRSILEIKTSARGDEWGEPHEGSAALPPRVLAQVYYQIQVAEAPRAYVGALLSGRGGFRFNIYRVEPAPDIQAMLEQKAVEFWNSFVIPRIPPPEAPRIDSLERMIREPGKRVEINPALIEEYLAAREQAKKADEILQAAKEKLLAAIGDAEEAEGGGHSVAYREMEQTRLDANALRAALPEVAAQYSKTSKFRKLLVK